MNTHEFDRSLASQIEHSSSVRYGGYQITDADLMISAIPAFELRDAWFAELDRQSLIEHFDELKVSFTRECSSSEGAITVLKMEEDLRAPFVSWTRAQKRRHSCFIAEQGQEAIQTQRMSVIAHPKNIMPTKQILFNGISLALEVNRAASPSEVKKWFRSTEFSKWVDVHLRLLLRDSHPTKKLYPKTRYDVLLRSLACYRVRTQLGLRGTEALERLTRADSLSFCGYTAGRISTEAKRAEGAVKADWDILNCKRR